jgi:hypothetical protein
MGMDMPSRKEYRKVLRDRYLKAKKRRERNPDEGKRGRRTTMGR